MNEVKFLADYKSAPESGWVEIEYGDLKAREMVLRARAKGESSDIVLRNLDEEAADAAEAADLIASSISWDEDGVESYSVRVWTAQDEDGYYYKYQEGC